MKKIMLLLSAVLVSLIFSSIAMAGMVVNESGLSPVEDTYIDSSAMNANFGNLPLIAAGTDSGTVAIARSYLKFNISGIPENITSAVLYVYSETPAGAPEIEAYGLTDDTWQESTLTFANAPGNPALYDFQDSVIITTKGWYAWNVTDFVVKSDDDIISIQLRKSLENTSQDNNTALLAREIVDSENESEAALAPYLLVEYLMNDTTAPDIMVMSPENRSYGSGGIWANITTSEEAVCIVTSGDDSHEMQKEGNSHYYLLSDLEDGGHSISFSCTDLGDNIRKASGPAFTVDTQAPAINISMETETPAAGKRTAVSYTASDNINLEGVSLFVGGEELFATSVSGKEASGTFNWEPETAGPYDLVMVASDSAGNKGESRTLTAEVISPDTSLPVVQAPTISETSPSIGEVVTFRTSIADNRGLRTASLEIDGVVVDSEDISGLAASVELEFNTTGYEPGTYAAKILATDQAGNTGESVPHAIEVKAKVDWTLVAAIIILVVIAATAIIYFLITRGKLTLSINKFKGKVPEPPGPMPG